MSFYNFMPAYMGLAGALSMQDFADAIFAGASVSGTIWSHFKTWLDARSGPNVLLIFFEDMKEDLEATVEQVADFMGISSRKVAHVCPNLHICIISSPVHRA